MTARPSPAPESGDSPEAASFGRPRRGWRRTFFVVIFESDTRAGRAFDVALIVAIFASVAVVMLDSMQSVGGRYPRLFLALEWGFTLLFTAEYLARLACVEKPARYAKSVFGVVDLLAILLRPL
jgi:voltage-gated potassium channel